MTEELKSCDCEEWKKYMDILTSQQVYCGTRSYLEKYPKEGIFKYCPWCGKQRETGGRE